MYITKTFPTRCKCNFLPSALLIFVLYKKFPYIKQPGVLFFIQSAAAFIVSSATFIIASYHTGTSYLLRRESSYLYSILYSVLIYIQSTHLKLQVLKSHNPLTFLTYVDLFFVAHVFSHLSVSFKFTLANYHF